MLAGIVLRPIQGSYRVTRGTSPAPKGSNVARQRRGVSHGSKALDPLYVEFLRNLRSARTRAGMSQVELAAALERPQSFVAKIETGTRRVDVAEAMRIAAVLGSNLAELLPHSDRLALSNPPRRPRHRSTRLPTA